MKDRYKTKYYAIDTKTGEIFYEIMHENTTQAYFAIKEILKKDQNKEIIKDYYIIAQKM